MVNVKPVKLGNTERMSFGKIEEVIDMPNLIEVQKESYRWFLEEGLKEVFKDVSGITDYQDNLVLDFIDYTLDVDHPNYSVIECKVRDATYSAALRVTARLLNKATGEIKESNVFMGDFPLMTPSGTFVINGAERVIVSQLVRSPGVIPPPLSRTAVHGSNMRPTSTMCSMSVSTKTASCLSLPLSVRSAWAPTPRSLISSATIRA